MKSRRFSGYKSQLATVRETDYVGISHADSKSNGTAGGLRSSSLSRYESKSSLSGGMYDSSSLKSYGSSRNVDTYGSGSLSRYGSASLYDSGKSSSSYDSHRTPRYSSSSLERNYNSLPRDTGSSARNSTRFSSVSDLRGSASNISSSARYSSTSTDYSAPTAYKSDFSSARRSYSYSSGLSSANSTPTYSSYSSSTRTPSSSYLSGSGTVYSASSNYTPSSSYSSSYTSKPSSYASPTSYQSSSTPTTLSRQNSSSSTYRRSTDDYTTRSGSKDLNSPTTPVKLYGDLRDAYKNITTKNTYTPKRLVDEKPLEVNPYSKVLKGERPGSTDSEPQTPAPELSIEEQFQKLYERYVVNSTVDTTSPTKESVEEAVVDDRKNKEDVEEEQNLLPKELDLLTKSTNDSDYCSGGEGGLSKEQSPIETPVNSGHNSDSESIVEAKRPQQPEIAEILQGEGDFHRDTSGCKKPLSLRLFDSTAKRQLSPEKKFLSEDHNVAVELSFTNPYGANRCGCPTTLPVLTRLNLTFPTIFFPETIVIANCQLEKPSPLESVVSTKPIGDLIVESATVTLLPTDTDDMGGSLGKKKNSADLKKPIELVEDDEMDAKTRWQKFCQANIQVVEPTATDPDDSTEELTVESVSDVEEDSVELDLSESIALPTPNVMEISTTSTISALEEDSFNAAEPLSVRVESRVSSRVRSASLSEPKTPNLSEIASGCAWQQFCYDLDDASEAEEELEKDNIATATATLGQPFYNITVTTVSQSDEEEESDSGDDSEDEEIQSAMQNIQILTSPIEEHLAMDSAFKSLETKPPIDIMKELMGLAEDEEEVESISDFEDYDSAEEDLYRPDSRSLYRDARSALSNQDLTAIPSIMVTSTEFSDAQQRDGDYSDVESVLGDVSSEAELSEEVGEEEEVEEMIKSSGSDEYSKAAETQLEQPTLANDVMTESAAEFYFNEGFRDHQKSLTPSDFEDVCVDEEIVGCADEQERTVETVSDVEEVEEIPDVIVEGNDIPLLFDRVLDEEEVEEDVEEAEVEDILAEEKVVEVEEIEDDLNDSTQLSREVTYTHQLKLNQVEQAEEGEVDDLFEEPHNAEKIVSGKVASNDYDFVVSVPLLVASVPNEESESFAEETVNFTLDEFQPQDHLALIRQAAEFAMVEPVKPLTYVRNETVNLATETAERLKVAKEQLAKATLLTEAQKATGKVQPERPQLTFVMADDTNCYSNELEELVDVSPTEFAAIDLKLHGVGETVHNRVQPTYVRPAFEEQTVEKAERLVLRKDYSTASATAGLIRGVSAKAKADKMVLTRAPSIEEVIKAESAQEIPSLRVSPETITKLHGMSERYQICVRPTLVKPIEGDTPTDKADRLVNRIESLKQDVKPKLVRGVAEKVRIGKQPVRVAVGKLDVPAHSALDMPNELLEPKYRGHGVYEVWTPAIRRTHVKPVGVEIIYDRMDYFSPKKPAEDFGKKSVHQGFKLDCCKVSQPQVLVGFNDLPDKLKKKFLPDAGGATVAQKTEEKMPEKLAKQPEANKNAKTSAQPQAKPEQKQLGDERKAKQTSVSPQPDSFELQMEELRSKLKLGSSTLTKQMKELSRGIATITAEAKLKTLETSETKAAITEAAQQRNEVTEKYSQWKSTAEEEFKKRETQISQIAEKTEKRGREMLELEKKAQPKPTAQLGLKSRPPGRVTSAFIEKEVEAERKPTVPAIKLAEPTKVVEPMKQSINNRKVEKSALSDVTNRTEPDGNAEGKNLTSLVEQTAVSHQTQRQEAELKGSKIVHADLLQHGVAEAKTKEANRLTSELSKSRLHSADEVAKVGSKEPQQKYQARVDSAKIKSTAELIEVEKPGETAKVGVKDAPHKYQSRLDSSKKLTSSAELIETAQVGVKDGQKYQSRLEPTKLVGISSTLEPSKVPRKSSRSRSSRRGAKRQNRFIGAIEDIDDLLKIKRLKTFEQFETLYDAEIRQKRPEGKVKRTRPEPLQLRTFIGDCEDFDEILGPKDLRAVMSQFSPTSRVTFDFFVNESTTKPPATGLKHKFGGKTTDLATKYRKLGDGAEAKQAKLVSMSKLVVNVQYLNDINPFTGDGRLEPIRPISYTFTVYIPLCEQIQPLLRLLRAPHKAESASLQIYQKNGDEFQTILDLDASLQDQPDELEMLKDSRKSLVLRTKISVRVHLIIEKLLNSTGRDLRRALFSLKQIFQDDKDLVHEFVQNDGLACLIKVGAEADQNYQNYILRALGQVMLYVDGMNGVIAHNETIQWLYSLLSSKFRLVVKTALKLLVVFVEYTESNSLLLLAAVYIVDKERDILPWANIMNVMSEKDTSDLELFLYAMTLVNKALHGIPDQDTYYDVVDSLEAQEIEAELQRLMSLGSKELTDQCLLYEETLKAEDGDDEALVSAKRSRAAPRHRSNIVNRKSRRTSEDQNTRLTPERTTKPSQHEHHQPNGSATYREKARYGEPKVVKKPDEDNSMDYTFVKAVSRDGTTKPDDISTNATVEMNKFRPAFKKQPSQEASVPGLSQNKRLTMNLLYRRGSVQADEDENGNEDELTVSQTISLPNAKPDASVEDQQVPKPPGFVTPSTGQVNSMADRFQKPLAPPQPTPVPKAEVPHQQEDSDEPPSNNFAAALSKARNSMASKIEKSGTAGAPKKKETDVEWAQAVENLNRPLVINDLDFTELDDSDDHDPFRFPSTSAMQNGPQMPPGGGMPPPPPFGQMGPPPPPGFGPPPPPMGGIPPPPLNRLGPPPPSMNGSTSPERSNSPNTTQKDVKTLRLFWKEVKAAPPTPVTDKRGGTFWDRAVVPVDVDTVKLCQSFETKAKEITQKKKEDKRHETIVLDTKRSNAICIGLTKLPPPRAIKAAIVKFDTSIMNKDGIEKILSTMMPTEEEKTKILDAQMANADLPLGKAEQFLLTLASIPELEARLKLWLFMMDYANQERAVAEPLMDLKLAMKQLETCPTFQYVMSTLLAVGNILNGGEVRGFQLDYLAKVPEIKDTVNKYSLVYHLCQIVMEKFPDSTDLYSELGAVSRCARVDFDEVSSDLEKMEKDCKESWDHLRSLAKYEAFAMNQKISEFLTDCAQRILTLNVIHRRVFNRFHNFLLFMGLPLHVAKDTKVNSICKIISEFSLEYRTTRERAVQMKKRSETKRERNKTRGKTIVDVNANLRGVAADSHTHLTAEEKKRHGELQSVLNQSNSADPSRLKSRPAQPKSFPRGSQNETQPSGDSPEEDDPIFKGLIDMASHADQPRIVQRRRAKQFNRKSLRRTRTLKLDDTEAADQPES